MRWRQQILVFFGLLCTINSYGVEVDTSGDLGCHCIVIDEEEWLSYNATNLGQVLQMQTGIMVSYTKAWGYQIDFGGFGFAPIRVMKNGVPYFPDVIQNADPGQVMLADVERIVICKMPYGLRHTSRSVAWVVNMEQRESVKKVWQSEASVAHDPIGLYNVSAHVNYRVTEHEAAVFGGRYFTHGWQDFDSGRVTSWLPQEQYFIGARYAYRISPALKMRVYGNYFQEKKRQKGYPAPQTTHAIDQSQFNWRADGGVELIGRISKYHRIEFHSVYNHYVRNRRRELTELTDLQQVYLTSGYEDSIGIGNFYTSLILTKKHPDLKWEYDFGFEYIFQQNLREVQAQVVQKDQNSFAPFVNVNRKLGKIELSAGLKLLNLRQEELSLQPLLMLLYQPKKGHEIRLGYQENALVPNFQQLYNLEDPQSTQILSQDLQTNYISQGFAQYTFRGKYLDLLAGLRYNNFQNAILLQSDTTGTYRYLNAGQLQFLDVNTEALIGGDFPLNIVLAANGIGQPTPNLKWMGWVNTQYKVGISFYWAEKGLKFDASQLYTSQTEENFAANQKVDYLKVSSWRMAQASIRYALWKEHIWLTFGMNNLWDHSAVNTTFVVHDQESAGKYILDRSRRIFFNLKCRF